MKLQLQAIVTRVLYESIVIEREAIEREVQEQVANWRGLLTGSVRDGRQLLREALEKPFRFERDGESYKFSALVATGRLIEGVIGRCAGQRCVASPTGVVPEWTRPVPGEVSAGSGRAA